MGGWLWTEWVDPETESDRLSHQAKAVLVATCQENERKGEPYGWRQKMACVK